MQFLADMGISMVTVNWLKSLGHDAKHLAEEKLMRLPDDLILKKAKAENRILLTCDLDFGYFLSLTKDTLPTIIIFRLEFQTPLNHIHKLTRLFHESMNALHSGSVISIDDSKIRIRTLPIS
jgi:predicted nuclease of predicted toxin-antitoxin system